MTQKELAKCAGITEGYVRKIEACERMPSLSVLTSIAAALNISLDCLWIDTGSQIEPEFIRKQTSYVPAVGGRLIQQAVKAIFSKYLNAEYCDIEDVVVRGIGISYNYYQEIVRGDKTPSFELLCAIADFLVVSCDELVFEHTTDNRH